MLDKQRATLLHHRPRIPEEHKSRRKNCHALSRIGLPQRSEHLYQNQRSNWNKANHGQRSTTRAKPGAAEIINQRENSQSTVKKHSRKENSEHRHCFKIAVIDKGWYNAAGQWKQEPNVELLATSSPAQIQEQKHFAGWEVAPCRNKDVTEPRWPRTELAGLCLRLEVPWDELAFWR